jgi:predicted transcriptional regulator
MSIHPGFAQLILEGEKKVEFRKTRFASQVSNVVIYATTPVKRVVGYFEVQGIQVATPKELWKFYNKVSGINQKFFEDYYENINQGVAIEVGEVYPLSNSLPLKYISTSLVAPQSYMYLNDRAFDLIKTNQKNSDFQ